MNKSARERDARVLSQFLTISLPAEPYPRNDPENHRALIFQNRVGKRSLSYEVAQRPRLFLWISRNFLVNDKNKILLKTCKSGPQKCKLVSSCFENVLDALCVVFRVDHHHPQRLWHPSLCLLVLTPCSSSLQQRFICPFLDVSLCHCIHLQNQRTLENKHLEIA